MRLSCKSGGCSGGWHPLQAPSALQHPKAAAPPKCCQLARFPCPLLWECTRSHGCSFRASLSWRTGTAGDRELSPGCLWAGWPLCPEPQCPHRGAEPTPPAPVTAEEVRRQPLAHCSARTRFHSEGTRPTKQGGVRWSHPLLHGLSTPETHLSWEPKQLPPSEGQRFINHFPIIIAGERMNSWLLKRFCPFLTGSV